MKLNTIYNILSLPSWQARPIKFGIVELEFVVGRWYQPINGVCCCQWFVYLLPTRLFNGLFAGLVGR
jgi:hypothetical protein